MIQHPYLSAIVAADRTRCIGKQGKVPWRCLPDLQRYKDLTVGKVCIVGSKTLNSLPKAAFTHDRDYVVLSRSSSEINTVEAALERATKIARHPEIMVIGGAQVYELFLPICQRIYLTELCDIATKDGDAFFPNFQVLHEEWEEKVWSDITVSHLGYVVFSIWDRRKT